MPKRTCFVICPLGEADSETRKRSDDLFDLVISPALATYEFEVIRADRIPGSGIITNEIISLIQSAELCIVDLTDHNPNVYYECGRRHENDLPFIHMMAESAGALPFDLAGIRTVRYSLEDARRVQAIQNELRRYVDEFERGGYQRIGGASPHEIAASLERIENRLKRLSASLTAPGSPQAQQQIGTRSLRIPSSESALSRVMMEAWFAQDWDSMATLFSAYL